ncbi:DUF1292 domain-containing protein [Paenibacillus sp. GD4]|jgi:uncharacterized protein YrzB (UPF0473 family)|uniref:DUF1292 domain-containing protein n=1 Tax=Paenibacillus TaxID=44249 RepID=UPI002543F561|nr:MULTISPECIES: DUF1292 domain-containing protein [Paenibacillus]MDQ1912462.1 DUF1292 domain-containing protein [Paenibacillus sp. GD4]
MDAASVKETRQLRDAFGDDIILYDEREESVVFRIVSEFLVGDQGYAVLEKENPQKDEGPEIFRVGRNAAGEPELESIVDDEEWENVSELYDEMTFPDDEKL